MTRTAWVIGTSNAARRIEIELAQRGWKVVCVQEARPLRAELQNLPEPQAILITGNDDHSNLQTTLLCHELLPTTKIVVRLFNPVLGKSLEAHRPTIRALSISDLAAPHFAAEALKSTGASPTADSERAQAVHPEPTFQLAKLAGSDPWILKTLLALVTLSGAATLYFAQTLDLSFGDALYFVVTTVTTTGFGDIQLKHAPFAVKAAGMALMLGGTSLFALLFALLTERLIQGRLETLLGRHPVTASQHVIVVGAGTIGTRVAEALLAGGHPVVAIERQSDGRFSSELKARKVPLVIEDATLPTTLELVQAQQARAIICATDHDLTNLEIAMTAKSLNPKIRTVLRVHAPDFAERLKLGFDIDASLSPVQIAAPAFAEAAEN